MNSINFALINFKIFQWQDRKLAEDDRKRSRIAPSRTKFSCRPERYLIRRDHPNEAENEKLINSFNLIDWKELMFAGCSNQTPSTAQKTSHFPSYFLYLSTHRYSVAVSVLKLEFVQNCEGTINSVGFISLNLLDEFCAKNLNASRWYDSELIFLRVFCFVLNHLKWVIRKLYYVYCRTDIRSRFMGNDVQNVILQLYRNSNLYYFSLSFICCLVESNHPNKSSI